MTIVFWGKGTRGVRCLTALKETGYTISLVVAHPEDDGTSAASVVACAKTLAIPVFAPEDPNASDARERLARENADLFVLGGYGKILRKEAIAIPRLLCINLHGGKLPNYRGSSPMNWALINGEKSFTLSIIQVNAGVDTGPLLLERTFPIDPDDTIRELHAIAEEQFPQMLCEVVARIAKGDTAPIRSYDPAQAGYYPLRFPDDGLILWDLFTAAQVHNRIRALTEPYPGAFTLWKGKQVKLLRSELADTPFFGEPGRIYQMTSRGLLVYALDRCLWITKAVLADTDADFASVVRRYDRLGTVREAAQKILSAGS